MKTLIFFLLLVLGINIIPQEKSFIYFKDKGAGGSPALLKGSSEYLKAESLLSGKSIERRKKILGEENYITQLDLPVAEKYIKTLEAMGVKIENTLRWFNAVTAYLTTGQIEQIKNLEFVKTIEKVKTLTGVRQASINPPLSKGKAVDPFYGQSYDQLALPDITTVQKKGITGGGVAIGLLDSGFDWQKPLSLRNSKVRGEYDFVFKDNVTANQSQDRSDQDGHGTAVLSTIAAYKPGEIIGAAYSAEFYLAKTEYVPTETKTEEDNFAAGVEWLEGKGVDVMTTSLGYNTFDNSADSYTYKDMNGQTSICTKAYEMAFSLGVVTVSSAGNEGNNSWKYVTAPADGFNVIATGNIDLSKNLAASSSRGPTYDRRTKPEVTALGNYVYSVSSGAENAYTRMSGTSLAAPFVCGTASLLLSAYPNLKNYQVRKILLTTAENASAPNNDIGWGLVSASRAISYPNIENVNGNFRINKIFFGNSSVKNNAVKISVSDDGAVFKTFDMAYENSLYYRHILQNYTSNKNISFYFDYEDSLGNKIREPQDINYMVNFGSTDVFYDNAENSGENFALSQNYPNPFNGNTSIDFIAKEDGNVTIKVFDILGREVKTLINNRYKIGPYSFHLNLSALASGIYIYQINFNGRLAAKKMILNK